MLSPLESKIPPSNIKNILASTPEEFFLRSIIVLCDPSSDTFLEDMDCVLTEPAITTSNISKKIRQFPERLYLTTLLSICENWKAGNLKDSEFISEIKAFLSHD